MGLVRVNKMIHIGGCGQMKEVKCSMLAGLPDFTMAVSLMLWGYVSDGDTVVLDLEHNRSVLGCP